MLNAEVFSDVANRFEVWYKNNNTGKTVVNARKDYLNRAQDVLQLYRPWEYLWVDLELSLVDRQQTLPSNWLRNIVIGTDQDNDGKLDYYYYRYGRKGRGFKIVSDFKGGVAAAGKSYVIKFFFDPVTPVIMRYQKILPDFEDSGVEPSYFPGELLLRTAQLAVLGEDGSVQSSEFQRSQTQWQRLMKDYEQAVQFDGDELRRDIVLESGRLLQLDSINLTGSDGGRMNRHGQVNSRDMGALSR